MDTRAARAGLALGILGGGFALWWAMRAGEGSSATALTSYAAAAAWGAAIGGAVGALAGASRARTTLPMGIGALVGAAGALGGMAVGVHVLGHDLLDGDRNVLMTSAFVGAGIGWTVGATAGAVVGRDAPAFAPSQVRVARAAAVGIGFVGVVIAAALGPGIDLASPSRSTGVMRAAAIADAVLVAVTLALVAGRGPRHEAETPQPARVVAAGGLALGCLAIVAFLALMPGTEVARDTRRLEAANASTAWSLAEAGTAYAERTGTIPSSIETLERAGGDVTPGSHVNGLWEMPRGFCVEVGTSGGGGVGVSPIRSEAVWFVETASGELRAKTFIGGVGGCEAMTAQGP